MNEHSAVLVECHPSQFSTWGTVLVAFVIISVFIIISELVVGVFCLLLMLIFIHFDLSKIVVYEDGVEVQRLFKTSFIQWEDISNVETALDRTVIFVKRFGINVPRLMITKGRQNYHETVKTIKALYKGNN